MAGRGRERARRGRRNALQHAAVLRARRLARRPAPQARAHRWRTHRLGPGRRLHPHRPRHRVRSARRADLLGELHAPRPRGALRARPRRAPRSHLGHQRLLAGHPAPHRQGGPRLRHRHQLLPPRQRRTRVAARVATRCTAATRTTSRTAAPPSSDPTGPCSPVPCTTRRASSTPRSTSPRPAPHGGSSTRSGTTRDPTSSPSPSTSRLVPAARFVDEAPPGRTPSPYAVTEDGRGGRAPG